MNERIKELEAQCWKKVPCDFDMDAGGLSTTRTVFDCNKFAELIINECATTGSKAMYPDSDPDYVGRKIREHFGVE